MPEGRLRREGQLARLRVPRVGGGPIQGPRTGPATSCPRLAGGPGLVRPLAARNEQCPSNAVTLGGAASSATQAGRAGTASRVGAALAGGESPQRESPPTGSEVRGGPRLRALVGVPRRAGPGARAPPAAGRLPGVLAGGPPAPLAGRHPGLGRERGARQHPCAGTWPAS